MSKLKSKQNLLKVGLLSVSVEPSWYIGYNLVENHAGSFGRWWHSVAKKLIIMSKRQLLHSGPKVAGEGIYVLDIFCINQRFR